MKPKVLFLCIHNSARSQMAEGLMKTFGGDKFYVESAGLHPCPVNPIVVEAMKEIGIDISRNKSQSVFDLLKEGKEFQYVITVCDETAGEQCPVFPSLIERLHWPFEDPVKIRDDTYEQKLTRTRLVRDLMKSRVLEWIASK